MIKAFIVHGQDIIATHQLKDFLRSLSVYPLVLEDEDDMGLTVIEKFEHFAAECELAFVLLTPDDQLVDAISNSSWLQARQNVLIELGWFIRHLGRRRVFVLEKRDTKRPTTLRGVIGMSFEESVLEVSEKIRQRLVGLGLL